MSVRWCHVVRRAFLVISCVLGVIPAFAAGSHLPQAFPKRAGGPVVTFASDRVRATGATAGAQVYFASVSLYGGGGMLNVARPAGVAVADADGNAELVTEVHTRSVWLVVDGAKGYTVAAPRGMLLQEMDFPGGARADGNGQLRRLFLSRFYVDVFLIRPGEGMWIGYFRDGGPLDDDGQPNGQNNGDVGALQPVAGTSGDVGQIKPGDYLFVVDRNSLEFHLGRRGAP